jgi:hypothetical protein
MSPQESVDLYTFFKTVDFNDLFSPIKHFNLLQIILQIQIKPIKMLLTHY